MKKPVNNFKKTYVDYMDAIEVLCKVYEYLLAQMKIPEKKVDKNGKE